MMKETILKIAGNEKFKNFMTSNQLVRPLKDRFIGGDTLDQAIKVGFLINREGKSISFDHLGEDVKNEQSAFRAKDEILELIDAISHEKINGGISIKPTHLGLDIDRALFEKNYYEIVDHAANFNIFVRSDMESSKYTDATLQTVYKLSQTHKNQGVALQAYLKRSLGDAEELIGRQIRVRLCKGAYMESPKVAFQKKRDVDSNYIILMGQLLQYGNYPAIATHDQNMIVHQDLFIQKLGISNNRFENEMLFGINYPLQNRLVDEGKNLGIYLPYGTSWYGYFTRRLVERPANLMFFLSNLLRH